MKMTALLSAITSLAASAPALADAKVVTLHAITCSVVTNWGNLQPLLVAAALTALGGVIAYRLKRAV